MSQLLRSVVILTNPRGAHDPAQTYAKMDEVQYQTSIYVAAEYIPAGVAITDPRWVCKLDNSAAYAAEQDRISAEGERMNAESIRGSAYTSAEANRNSAYESAESARGTAYQQAEAARGGEYDTAEAARDSEYDQAEASRDNLYTSAESTRNTAEETRAAFYDGFTSQLAAIGKFEATNMIAGGDFQSTTGWSTLGGTVSVANNVATVTGNGTNKLVQLYRNTGTVAIAGHKYYLRAKRRANSSLCKTLSYAIYADGGLSKSVGIEFPASGIDYTHGGVLPVPDTGTFGSMYVYAIFGYDSTSDASGATQVVSYMSALDLTAIFGAGNEPTAAQMDAILARWPNSWFDGTENLARADKAYPALVALKNQLDEKTGYGVVSGLGVTAQSTPDMSVSVAAGTCYKADGTRFNFPSAVTLAATAADATNPRIDIVYVSTAGVRTYLAGTAGATPAAPATPTDGTLLAEISVAAGATTVAAASIASRKKGLFVEDWITPTLINGSTHKAGRPLQYRKTRSDMLEFRGQIENCPAAYVAFMTLPAGYRPPITMDIAGIRGGLMTVIGVVPGGSVSQSGAAGSYVLMDGIQIPLT